MTRLERQATRHYTPTEALDTWVEEKECRALVSPYPGTDPFAKEPCGFIGEVTCVIWPGTGRATEWDCPDPEYGGCGTHHFEEKD